MRAFILLLLAALWTQNLSAIESNKTLTSSAKNDRWELVCTFTEVITLTPERNFYIKCDLKNLGKETVEINKRACIWVRSEEDPKPCPRYLTVRKASVPPGGKVSWWQHSIFKQSGKFSLYAQLEHDASLITDSVKVTFKMADDQFSTDPYSSVTKAFQLQWAGFPKAVPNLEGPAKVHFEPVNFAAEPVIVGGQLYYGFVFRAPKEPGNLIWAFAYDNSGPVRWDICRRRGSMTGFRNFEYEKLGPQHKALGFPKGSLVFQSFEAENFLPDEEYLIYFSTVIGSINRLDFSLNFSQKPTSSFQEFFPKYYSR